MNPGPPIHKRRQHTQSHLRKSHARQHTVINMRNPSLIAYRQSLISNRHQSSARSIRNQRLKGSRHRPSGAIALDRLGQGPRNQPHDGTRHRDQASARRGSRPRPMLVACPRSADALPPGAPGQGSSHAAATGINRGMAAPRRDASATGPGPWRAWRNHDDDGRDGDRTLTPPPQPRPRRTRTTSLRRICQGRPRALDPRGEVSTAPSRKTPRGPRNASC